MLSWGQVGRWVLGGSAIGLGGWSARVAYERSRELPPERSAFRPGSADDVLLDALETGDLVLFERDCALMQPLGAAVCALTKRLPPPLASQYDHVGMVVVDRLGVAHVLEHTFSGAKLRPFEERILRSRSQQVIVMPLRVDPDAVSGPRVARPTRAPRNAMEAAMRAAQEAKAKAEAEQKAKTAKSNAKSRTVGGDQRSGKPRRGLGVTAEKAAESFAAERAGAGEGAGALIDRARQVNPAGGAGYASWALYQLLGAAAKRERVLQGEVGADPVHMPAGGIEGGSSATISPAAALVYDAYLSMGLIEPYASSGDVAAAGQGSVGKEPTPNAAACPESIAGVLLPADWWQLRPRSGGSKARKGRGNPDHANGVSHGRQQPLIRLRQGLSYGTPVPVRICAGDL